MTTGENLVDEFVKYGWKSNPFDKLIPLLHDERDQALPLALLILDRLPKGGTFFDFLLSHLSEAEFEALLNAAMEKLKDGKTDVLESVIAYASIQLPQMLTPFLRKLFMLEPNSGSYYEWWPWRAADAAEIKALEGLVLSNCDLEIRNRAWRCLVETRQSDCIAFAAEHFPAEMDCGRGFDAYANLVGFDVSSRPPRKLHRDQSYHIIFPADCFEDTDRPVWKARCNHPTWSLGGPIASGGHFGGESKQQCGLCGGILHSLLQIDDASLLLGLSLPNVELVTCLSCLGWEANELFYWHDSSGKPSSLNERSKAVVPEFPAVPLKETSVRYVLSPPRWTFQDWALSNSRENLNRVGGAPCWVQDSQYPSCPKCKKLMGFIAQLDSGLPTADGGEWLWGSGGICYLFWCDICHVSANLWQCT